jgi:hypothetical protein
MAGPPPLSENDERRGRFEQNLIPADSVGDPVP